MLNEEKTYPDPSKFKPERFIKDGELDPSVQDPELAAFGYGRRIWWVPPTPLHTTQTEVLCYIFSVPEKIWQRRLFGLLPDPFSPCSISRRRLMLTEHALSRLESTYRE